MVGRLSGIRTQSGQTKINNVLTAQIFPPNLEMRAVPRLVSFTSAFALQLRKITENLSQGVCLSVILKPRQGGGLDLLGLSNHYKKKFRDVRNAEIFHLNWMSKAKGCQNLTWIHHLDHNRFWWLTTANSVIKLWCL